MGKDVTALWQAGARIRDWVQSELGAAVCRIRGRMTTMLTLVADG
jgi:hypothetical protein